MLTRVPDGAVDGVALLQEELHEPGRDETAGAGHTDGASAASGDAVSCVGTIKTHVSICREFVNWKFGVGNRSIWICMYLDFQAVVPN
jgi:hypothetical protein